MNDKTRANVQSLLVESLDSLYGGELLGPLHHISEYEPDGLDRRGDHHGRLVGWHLGPND